MNEDVAAYLAAHAAAGKSDDIAVPCADQGFIDGDLAEIIDEHCDSQAVSAGQD